MPEWCHGQKSTVHAINNHFKAINLLLRFLGHCEGISRPKIFLKNPCLSHSFFCLSLQYLPFQLLKSPLAFHFTFSPSHPLSPHSPPVLPPWNSQILWSSKVGRTLVRGWKREKASGLTQWVGVPVGRGNESCDIVKYFYSILQA